MVLFNYIIQHAIQSNVVKTSLGDLSGRGTPGPIPNPVVKPVSADGTWRATSWESRSLPRGFSEPPVREVTKRDSHSCSLFLFKS